MSFGLCNFYGVSCMIITALSDSHTHHEGLIVPPETDVLISAGDYSFRGTEKEVKDFHTWLNKQPGKHKISLAGNHEVYAGHDFYNAKRIAEECCHGLHFLEESALEIEGKKFFFSAWTPYFQGWAYNAQRGDEIAKHWAIIPDDTEILVNHGQPYQINDTIYNFDGTIPRGQVGCWDLMNRIKQLENLKVFIGGHIHSDGGKKVELNGVHFYNVAIVDESYYPVNQPTVIEI
jgi:predicted phosphodiesterase